MAAPSCPRIHLQAPEKGLRASSHPGHSQQTGPVAFPGQLFSAGPKAAELHASFHPGPILPSPALIWICGIRQC